MKFHSILIIDDSKLVNNSLAASLRKRGYEVEQAFDIAQAKALLHDKEFDFALLDLFLPDGEGEELLPYLQAHEELRVIVLTSDRDKDRRERLFGFGAVIDYIVKDRPFDDMELAIVKLIDRITTNADYTILVVDDSNFMRTTLRIHLSKRGFRVIGAIDGKEALKLLQKHRVDAAMIDLEMPVMDGNKLLNSIRRNRKYLMMPVMVLSGSDDPEKIAHVIKNGANDFIKKPYITEELLLKVDKMIEELKLERMTKAQELRFATYNRAIDAAAIFVKLDKEMRISYYNSAFKEIFDCSDAECQDRDLTDLLDTAETTDFEAVKKALHAGQSKQLELQFSNNSESNVILRLTFSPIVDAEEKLDEILAIGFDVSLLYAKEQELRKRVENEVKKNIEQNKLLVQQSKMATMGEMIGHIGHQWRQPLNALGLLFQKVRANYSRDRLTTQMMDESTEKAMNIVKQMSETIDDFRNFFSSDKAWQKAPLDEVVEQAVGIIQGTLTSKGITLRVDVLKHVNVICLRNELAQVILNLLTNGMEAILDNGVTNGELAVTINQDDTDAILAIEDNAGGIPENTISRIFEPYFTTKTASNGTGIGLYMSQTIIQEHMKGKIEVSNTDKGALFTIHLPLNQPDIELES